MSSAIVELPVGLYQREMMMSVTSACKNEVLSSPSCAPKSPRPGGGGAFVLNKQTKQLSTQLKDFATNVKTILPKELAIKLDSDKDSKLLLLDCRPFIAYNLNHISGALNISCCDRLTKRKLERGKASVGDLVSGHQNAKNIFKEYLKGSDIVLYDDSTSDIKDLPSSNPLSLVLSNLVKDGHKVFILKGNFYK